MNLREEVDTSLNAYGDHGTREINREKEKERERHIHTERKTNRPRETEE